MDGTRILQVEDNPGDVELFAEALAAVAWDHQLDVVPDGAAALRYLERCAAADPRALPGLILLDLSLPGLSGREVLARIKADPGLAAIPVIITSGSEWDRDILREFALPTPCYQVKPSTFGGYQEVATRIRDFLAEKVVDQ